MEVSINTQKKINLLTDNEYQKPDKLGIWHNTNTCTYIQKTKKIKKGKKITKHKLTMHVVFHCSTLFTKYVSLKKPKFKGGLLLVMSKNYFGYNK